MLPQTDPGMHVTAGRTKHYAPVVAYVFSFCLSPLRFIFSKENMSCIVNKHHSYGYFKVEFSSAVHLNDASTGAGDVSMGIIVFRIGLILSWPFTKSGGGQIA